MTVAVAEKIVEPLAEAAPHPYNRRSARVRLAEDRAYFLGMAKMCEERGYPNLAYSYLLYADEIGEIKLERSRN